MSIGFLGLWIAAGSVSWDFFTAVWILTNQLMTASLVNGGAHNGSRMPAVGELIFLFSLIASILQMDCMRGDVSDERILNIGMLIFFLRRTGAVRMHLYQLYSEIFAIGGVL